MAKTMQHVLFLGVGPSEMLIRGFGGGSRTFARSSHVSHWIVGIGVEALMRGMLPWNSEVSLQMRRVA